MPRRAALPSALALALLAAACAPSGGRELAPEPDPEAAVEGSPPVARPPHIPKPRVPVSTPVADPFDATCGAIPIEPVGAWRREGARLGEVRRGWHPRAEHGQPVAVREARPPFEVPGHTFWQVQVAGAPREIQPCFLVDGELPPVRSFDACVPAWELVGEATPEARPRTHEQWAWLLGLLDGASAVYLDLEQLDHCVSGLPTRVRAAVPSLGLRRSAGELDVAFVERIDAGRELTLLVAVHARLAEGRLELERQELWTIDREVAR